ncbi:MAG: hypothetical protein U1C96_10520 [Gallionella sp.]|nr:hypothetical protein [Gallionella sp.]
MSRHFLHSVLIMMCAVFSFFTVSSWAVEGGSHRLFADQDGRLWAWGAGEYGQLGLEGRVAIRVPQALTIPEGVAAVAAGMRHSVALDAGGAIWVWGDNSAGQLGTGDFKRLDKPSRLGLGGVTAIASGVWHSVALDSEGRVWVWGSGTRGQLGGGRHDAFTVSAKPLSVGGLGKVVAIASGDHHVLALTATGSVWSWGGLRVGADGENVVLNRPVEVAGLSNIRAISAGKNWSQAVDGNGSIWAWGRIPGAEKTWSEPQVRAAKLPSGGEAPVVVSGRVSADGQPVADAEVSAEGEVCGRTDGLGVYRCLMPVGFKGALKAQKDGFSFSAAKVTVSAKKTPRVDVAGRAEGRVLSPETKLAAVRSPAAPIATPGDVFEAVREKSFPQPVKTAPPAARPPAAPVVAPVAPEVKHEVAQAEVPPPKKETAVAATVRIFGSVRLSGDSLFGGSGRPVAGAQISGEGARCGKTDGAGEYVCTVPHGWTGRLAAVKRDYRFSPKTLFFRSVSEDRAGQDFIADYWPD